MAMLRWRNVGCIFGACRLPWPELVCAGRPRRASADFAQVLLAVWVRRGTESVPLLAVHKAVACVSAHYVCVCERGGCALCQHARRICNGAHALPRWPLSGLHAEVSSFRCKP